jgi:tRNA(Ile)-lysidine synthase
MNADLRFARVRFRRHVMPALRAENPALDDALCRLAASAREWMGTLDELAGSISKFPLDCGTLVRIEEPSIRKRGYALALEEAGLGYDAVHLDAIDDIVTRPSAGELSVDVPGGRVVRSYNDLDVAPPQRDPDELVAPSGHELRIWRPGDRMKPARLKGRSRKLSDLYIDVKVPRERRRTARVLIRTDDQVIVWAEHLGLAFGVPPSLVPVPRRTAGSF